MCYNEKCLASCDLANARQAKKWGDIYTIYLYISPLFGLSCICKIERCKILLKQMTTLCVIMKKCVASCNLANAKWQDGFIMDLLLLSGSTSCRKSLMESHMILKSTS